MYISGSSTTSRITGLVSGLDTDEIVADLMEAESYTLNSVYQKKQLAEWKLDEYREVSNALRVFQETYFDSLNSSSNMLSSSTYDSLTTTSTNTSIVTATADDSSSIGSTSIIVNNLATAAIMQSSSSVTQEIQGTQSPDFVSAQGKSIEISLDGTTRTIEIDESITDIDSLQDAIDDTFGSDKISVTDTNGDGTGALIITSIEDSGVQEITLSAGSSDVLEDLGFDDNDDISNRITTSDSLDTISEQMGNAFTFDSNDQLVLTINGETFSFDKDTSLDNMISEINSNEEAGVTMEYDEITDTFVFTADQTGAGNTLEITETGSTFLTAANIDEYIAGEDAEVTIDGEKITRSNNNFTVGGITYSMKGESTEEQTITISQDTEETYEKIVEFVNAYNDLLDLVNGKLSEEYDRDYQPLTEAQKEEMTESEIELWEKKASTGLLSNDSTLETIVTKMRRALYDTVEGVSTSLSSIGITTDTYDQQGKLVIDEDALREAIESDPSAVTDLFSKESTSYSSNIGARTLDATERSVRYEEEGLAYRLYDIIQDNISTYRDSSGNKGILLEKAGTDGDITEYDNILYNQISDYEEEIDQISDRLEDKEEYYYSIYASLETALYEMNTQSEWLSSQLEST